MKEILSSTEYYKSAKPGSLAEKAGMVARYNEKNKKYKEVINLLNAKGGNYGLY